MRLATLSRRTSTRASPKNAGIVPDFVCNTPIETRIPPSHNSGAMCLAHFRQSQILQVHSLPLFIGQFLPVFLQFGSSAAKAVAQRTAIRIENRAFVCLIIN